MSRTYEMHVICNTHWDREWACDFQETRMRLIDFVDRLLDILDEEPEYKSFLLDSQTVPVEDYLAVRPEQRKRIRKHVSGGRIQIGPWYTCPEEFSVNAESLVRNLLVGHRLAQEFGGAMKVGYSPFSYGQTSQMPQIYAGFGIDTILFYHGVTHDEISNEFILKGPDGTSLLASQISAAARYNFYHDVYRKVVRKFDKDDRLYTWDKGGLPFHLATEERCLDHYSLLDPMNHFAAERIKECIHSLRDREKEVATTRYIAFMNGHDASVADKAVLRIIEEAQEYIGRDKLFHSRLPDLMEKVKKAAKNLPVLEGERRTPKVRTGRVHLYSDVLSNRTRMKHLNARTEDLLQRWAEPYSTLTWCLGGEYPSTLLDMAWKNLLQGHAHDSIAGSGVDDIEKDMTHRLRQTGNISNGLIRRSLQHIQGRIDNSGCDGDDVVVTAFNASPYSRSEVLTLVLDIPPARASREFSFIEADTRRKVPVQMVSRKPHHVVVDNPGDAAHTMQCERAVCHLEARKIPALGYATYLLDPEGTFERGGLVRGQNEMENEHLHVRINHDGTLTIGHKPTGTVYEGLHYFEDGGEAGQAWMHVEPGIDRVLTSHGFPVAIAQVENGPLLARFRIDYRMRVPVDLDNAGSNEWERIDGFDNAACRTEETCELVVRSTITLRKGAQAVEVTTRFHNTARRHRLRVMFPTRLASAKTCHAESAFDVVERPIKPGRDSPWYGVGRRTYPMQRFVDVSDGTAGLAIVNNGLREYEVTPDAEKTIAVTLLRAYQVSICSSAAGWEIHPEMELSESLGDHEFRYFIYPHAGRWDEGEVHRKVERLNVPINLAQAGPHGGDLPRRQSFLEIQPANLLLSALKQSEDGNAATLRIYNPTERRIDGKLKFFQKLKSAELVTLEELPLRKIKARGKSLNLRVGSRKIVTIRIELE